MDERIRSAFEEIRADEAIKEKTRRAVLTQAGNKSAGANREMRFVPVLACLALLVTGSWKLYFTPTAVISVDINPSVEMSVNRFDRVISAVGMNGDGEKLLHGVDLKHLTCEEAIGRILTSEPVAGMLEKEEVLEIGVVGEQTAQKSRLLSELQQIGADRKNVTCYSTDREELEAAHALGMSCGKYRVYAILQQNGTELTPAQAQQMTMRQLRELAGIASGGQDSDGQCSGQGQQNRYHGGKK